MEKLEIGKNYKIGKYDKCRIGGNYFLCSDDIENTNIYTQFGITKEDIYKILGYTPFGIFPTCKSLEDLQKVYEYIMSKDPTNKQEDKFIVGKWYKRDTGSYVKFLELRYNIFISSEELLKSNSFQYFKGEGSMGDVTSSRNTYTLLEDLSEIQQYLPIFHPDKLPEKKSLVFKKDVWYKYHGEKYYMHCYKDAIDTLFYDKFIEVSTGYIGTGNSSYSNQYITDEEVLLSVIEKYFPNENIKREDLIAGQIYVSNLNKDKPLILKFSGDLEKNNHHLPYTGVYAFGPCCSAAPNFRLATKEEKELLISKIPKETMKEQVNFIHGEYYVDRVNSGGSRIFKYDKPDHQLYYINTAVKCFFIDNYDSSLEKDSVPATQKEIDWLNKCIKANRFVSEDYFVELTSLPEKWCISRNLTSEQNKIITKWINTKFNYAYSSHLINDYYYHDGYHGSKSDYTSKNLVEITYEQFKKWVMKKEEPDILPHEIPNTAFISRLKETYYVGQPLSELNIPDIGFIVYNEQNKTLGFKYNLTSDKLYKDLKITELKPGYFAIGNWAYKWFKISEIEASIQKEKTINSSTNIEYSTKGALPLYNVKKRLVLN